MPIALLFLLRRKIWKVFLTVGLLLLLYGIYVSDQQAAARQPKPLRNLVGVSIYQVKAGDYLLEIASRHGYADAYQGAWEIKQANHLKDSMIYTNEKLILPKP